MPPLGAPSGWYAGCLLPAASDEPPRGHSCMAPVEACAPSSARACPEDRATGTRMPALDVGSAAPVRGAAAGVRWPTPDFGPVDPLLCPAAAGVRSHFPAAGGPDPMQEPAARVPGRPLSAPPARLESDARIDAVRASTDLKCGERLSLGTWAKPVSPSFAPPYRRRRVVLPPPPSTGAAKKDLDASPRPSTPVRFPSRGVPAPGWANRQRVAAMGATLGALQAAVPWEAQREGKQDEFKARATTMTLEFLNAVKAQTTQRSVRI